MDFLHPLSNKFSNRSEPLVPSLVFIAFCSRHLPCVRDYITSVIRNIRFVYKGKIPKLLITPFKRVGAPCLNVATQSLKVGAKSLLYGAQSVNVAAQSLNYAIPFTLVMAQSLNCAIKFLLVGAQNANVVAQCSNVMAPVLVYRARSPDVFAS